MQIQNSTILLTGATGGIGQQVAEKLAEQGARLVLVGRKQSQLDTLCNSLSGSDHSIVCADLTASEGRASVVQYADKQKVDTLINLAGVNQFALLSDMTDKQLSDLLNCNLQVPMQLCRDMLPVLKQRKQSMVVNVGSTLGSIGLAGSSAYCASKFGLRGFTEALRRELADSVIRVVYFAPRATDTSMNDENVNAMNKELGNKTDSAQWVAEQLIKVLSSNAPHNHYLGWPEKLFVRLNGLLPKVVDGALRKQLTVIQKYCQK